MSDNSPATYTRGPCGHLWFMAVDGPRTAGEIGKAVRDALEAGGSVYHSSVAEVKQLRAGVCKCSPPARAAIEQEVGS